LLRLAGDRTHGNAGGLTSHLAENEGLGAPATAGMGTKVAKKWDRKLRNRAAKKDACRAAAM
jgi:hypothetical protein